ncbi:homeobox domain-containing protein, partial [Blyttiomyces helicus]
RPRATPEQLAILEEQFQSSPSPSLPIREALAAQLAMEEKSVQIWFQNRRAKAK